MKSVLLIVLCFSLYSCSSVKVIPAGNNKLKGKSVIYALPENVIVARIVVEEKHVFKGPYAEFASEFLSLDKVPLKNSVEYKISSVELQSYTQADPLQYYFMKSTGKSVLRKICLDKNMVLCGFNAPCEEKMDLQGFSYLKADKIPAVLFPDACNDGTVKEIIDTTYRTVQSDTSFIKVPVLKKHNEAKTIRDKAEDAATHLMRIRKRSFKFISGAYEKVPEQGTVEPALAEMKIEEDEYLTLFTGKEYVNVYSVYFTVVPTKDSSITLSWFSDKGGFSSVQKQGFLPVSLDVISTHQQDSINKYSYSFEKGKSASGVIYRVPGMADVTVRLGNNMIYRKQMSVAQFGSLQLLHKSIIKKAGNRIVFSPASGHLMKID